MRMLGLTRFMSLASFYTPWKHQKTRRFLKQVTKWEIIAFIVNVIHIDQLAYVAKIIFCFSIYLEWPAGNKNSILSTSRNILISSIWLFENKKPFYFSGMISIRLRFRHIYKKGTSKALLMRARKNFWRTATRRQTGCSRRFTAVSWDWSSHFSCLWLLLTGKTFSDKCYCKMFYINLMLPEIWTDFTKHELKIWCITLKWKGGEVRSPFVPFSLESFLFVYT